LGNAWATDKVAIAHKKKNQAPKTTKPASRKALQVLMFGGRYWDRTSDPYRVKEKHTTVTNNLILH